MKIALYIEDGLEQIVLTPETETEKGIVRKMHDDHRTMSVYRGEFYPCQGGWTRHARQSPSYIGQGQSKDDSTIIVLTPKEGKGES